MNRYKIYCTIEQTKKALELGAPIELESEYYDPTKNDFKLDEPIPYESFVNGYHYAKCPTAEEMIGWLEEEGILIELSRLFGLYAYRLIRILKFGEGNLNLQNQDYQSRKAATLAAIDTALGYLIENKK